MKRITLAATLALSLSVAALSSSWSRPAPFGPGGVLDTLVQYCEAYDDFDLEQLGTLMLDRNDGILFVPGDKGFRTIEDPEKRALFYDVSWDENEFGTSTRMRFMKALDAEFLQLKEEKGSVRTVVNSVHADCHSGELSFATFELDRIYTLGDGQTRTSPLRGTALMSHRDGRFRIWHWHVSPR